MKYALVILLLIQQHLAFSQMYHDMIDSAKNCMARKEYTMALQFIAISDTSDMGARMCSNMYEMKDQKQGKLRATCYYELGQIDNAIKVLLPVAFSLQWGTYEEMEVTNLLNKVLRKKYSDKQIQEEVRGAWKTIILSNDMYERYKITLFGTTLGIGNITSYEYYYYTHNNTVPPVEIRDSIMFEIVPVAKSLPLMRNKYEHMVFYKFMTNNILVR